MSFRAKRGRPFCSGRAMGRCFGVDTNRSRIGFRSGSSTYRSGKKIVGEMQENQVRQRIGMHRKFYPLEV